MLLVMINKIFDDKYMFVYYFSVWDNMYNQYNVPFYTTENWLIIFIKYFVLCSHRSMCNVILQIISDTLARLTE